MKIPFLARFFTPDTDPMPPKIVYADSLNAKHKAQFGTLLLNIVSDLPDLLAVSVMDLKAGTLLATYHIGGKLNPAKAAAANAEVIRQKQLALPALGLPDEAIEDILITLDTQWHILRLLPDNRHFVHLMVNQRDTNLGIAREVVRARAAGSPE
jgi:hypothetical protein